MSGSGIRRAFGKAPGSLDPSSAALPECWTKPSSGRNWMDGEMARCLALGRRGGGGRGGGADPRGSRRGAGRGSSNATWARCKQAGGPSARVELSDWPSNSTVHLRPSLGGGGLGGRGPGGLGAGKKERWVGSNEGIKKSGPLAVGHLRRGEVEVGTRGAAMLRERVEEASADAVCRRGSQRHNGCGRTSRQNGKPKI